jgi:hypothetical protein
VAGQLARVAWAAIATAQGTSVFGIGHAARARQDESGVFVRSRGLSLNDPVSCCEACDGLNDMPSAPDSINFDRIAHRHGWATR